MPVTWKFVDTPVTTPATLFDMNDKLDCALDMGAGFDISPPELKKSVSKSNMRDGGQLTASYYENRVLQFSVGLLPSSTASKEQLLTELNQELAKSNNLIMYKSDSASVPVFFRTVRSDNYKFVNRGGSRKIWNVDCAVEAEPFAIGVRQTPLNAVTITNNPASGANPGRIDISGITGDSPSPAFLNIGTNLTAATYFILSQETRSPTIVPFVQAESGTLGTDTTLPGADAAMSGGGSSYARTNFATNSDMATRLTLTTPVTVAGTYRVFARVRGQTATGTYKVRINFPNVNVAGQPAEFTLSSGVFHIIDLGLFDFPTPAMYPDMIGYSNLTGTHVTQTILIQAQRTSVSGSLDFDYFYLMPGNERMCTFQTPAAIGRLIVDGANEIAYGMTSGSSPFGGTRIIDNQQAIIPLHGGVPQLVPGVTNRWFIMQGMTTAISNTFSLTVDYWPRWRQVAIP
jgi:hypothetical protein